MCHGQAIEALRCPFKALTGVPCVGCGGTRAALLLARGDLCGALWTNPLSVVLCLWLAISYVWIIVDAVRGRNTYWPLYRKRPSGRIVAVVVAALLANWIWNIVKGL
ncbi:hypothetical protein FACS1894159_11630 [Bacteroidia bacterium]|nr:hypothetical protein FACS1894159_11630 [Bacteroidia bacterium]